MGSVISSLCRRTSRYHDPSSGMPAYFTDEEVHDEDIKLALSSWEIIMNGKNTSQFLIAKEQPNFVHSSSLTWFFDTFYEKMFEICPETRAFFVEVSITAQGKLLAAVITAALGMLKDPKKLRAKLTAMTENHNRKGIKSVYYSHMGSALIYALSHVLGSDFDKKTEHSWIKIYSFLLSIIIPLVVDNGNLSHSGSPTENAATLPPSHVALSSPNP